MIKTVVCKSYVYKNSSDKWESGISDPDRFDKSIIKLTTKEGTVSSMIHG